MKSPLAVFVRVVKDDLPSWMSDVVDATLRSLHAVLEQAESGVDLRPVEHAFLELSSRRSAWLRRLNSGFTQAMLQDAASDDEVKPSRSTGLALSLVPDESIDEQIALSRIAIVGYGEGRDTLRELESICASMRGWTLPVPEANPFRPQVVSLGLQRVVQDAGLPPSLSKVLLDELSRVIGSTLISAYTRHLHTLRNCGVTQQARTLEPPGALVKRGGAADANPVQQVIDRLLDDVALGNPDRTQLMRLVEPASRLARRVDGKLPALSHPLWQLLDRLFSAAAVHEELTVGKGEHPSLVDTMVSTLEGIESPRPHQLQRAIATIDSQVSVALSRQLIVVQAQLSELQVCLEQHGLSKRLRQHVLEHLESSAIPAMGRTFLLEAWVPVMTHSALKVGSESNQFMAQAQFVDELIAAFGPPKGHIPLVEDYRRLMAHARTGLLDAGNSPPLVARLVRDLVRSLPRPGVPTMGPPNARAGRASSPAAADSIVFAASDFASETAASLTAGTSGDTLATDQQPSTVTRIAHDLLESILWMEALNTGQFVRLYLQGKLVAAQLAWISGNRSMFVFSSRHGGRMHTLSDRSLAKLHARGLARSLNRGDLVADAISSLPAALSSPMLQGAVNLRTSLEPPAEGRGKVANL